MQNFDCIHDWFSIKSDPEGIRTPGPQIRNLLLYPAELRDHIKLQSPKFEVLKLRILNLYKSGWQDSNLRPSAPKADAIPGYATPRKNLIFNSLQISTIKPVNQNRIRISDQISFAERGGFEPPVRVTPYDSLANCWFQPLTHLS